MAEPEKNQQPDQRQSKTETASAAAPAAANSELPQLESPPLSPAGGIGEPEKAAELADVIDIAAAAPAVRPNPKRPFLTRRMRRNALFAASVMIAAATGAVIGALAVPGTPLPARTDSAGTEERASMQKSIAHLSKEVSALKAGIETASKGTGAQIGKIGDRLERIEKSDRLADTTGSIAKPAAAAAPAAPARAEAPLPTPRPAVILSGWALRDAANGRAVIENRNGDYYDVRPGDPLPGIGTVEAIKRDNGAWQVVTTKGIIAGSRPAATASAPARRRSYYSPYYWPY